MWPDVPQHSLEESDDLILLCSLKGTVHKMGEHLSSHTKTTTLVLLLVELDSNNLIVRELTLDNTAKACTVGRALFSSCPDVISLVTAEL